MKFKEFIKKLKIKYNVVVIDENTLTERFNVHLSWLKLINFLGLLILVVFTLLSLLVFATPLKNYLPGFEDSRTHRAALEQAARMDSLEREIEMAEQQLYYIKCVVAGELSVESIAEVDTTVINRNKGLKIDASAREREFVEEHNEAAKEKNDKKKK